jgi:hypothetical protein
VGLIYCVKQVLLSAGIFKKLQKIYCRINSAVKGGVVQDAYYTFQLRNTIRPELIVRKLAKATATSKVAGISALNDHDPNPPSEMAKRDPLFPVIIITGNSYSFKINHLAIFMRLDPCSTLHLVVSLIQGPWATDHALGVFFIDSYLFGSFANGSSGAFGPCLNVKAFYVYPRQDSKFQKGWIQRRYNSLGSLYVCANVPIVLAWKKLSCP